MGHFFAMIRSDRWYLLALVVFSVIAFMPWWREMYLAGMSVFGWLMAVLMVFSPTLAVFVFRQERRARRDRQEKEAGAS